MPLLFNNALLTVRSHSALPRWPSEPSAPLSKLNKPRLPKKTSVAALIDLARDPVGSLGEAAQGWYDGLTKAEREENAIKDARKRVLYLQQRNATCYDEWEQASRELDELENNNAWKREFESPDYYPAELEQHLQQLDAARLTCDVRRMLFLVRTSLSRNLAAMGNLRLYQYAHIGTKDLVERYIRSALDTLHALVALSDQAETRPPPLTADDGRVPSPMEIYNAVLAARQSFGRSALLLSGGATFGMNHIGVLKTLWAARLLPRIISGASAGSIVSAVMCVRTDAEIPHLLESFCNGDLAVFEEEGVAGSWLAKLARLLKMGAMFDIKHLTRVMRGLLGDLTFMEAYYRTRKILNICVSSASVYELPRLLNYVTAPNVVIWSAVAASCSVPLVFSSASLLAKDPKTQEIAPWNQSPSKWIDGSVDNDLPMQRLSEMFNVNHFIVSQVNPHVVPFLSKDEDLTSSTDDSSTLHPPIGPSWLLSATQFAKTEAMHRLTTLADLGVFPNTLTKAVSVLSQKYSGDITILPEISYADFPRMLSNPTPHFMQEATLRGERAAWPKLSRIRNHCAIELALDEAAHAFRARTAFSGAQEELRRGLVTRSKSDYVTSQPPDADEEEDEPNAVGGVGSSPTARRSPMHPRRRGMSQSSAPDATILELSRRDRVVRARRQAADHHKTRSANLDTGQHLQPNFFLAPNPDDESADPTKQPVLSPSLASTTTATLPLLSPPQSTSSLRRPSNPGSSLPKLQRSAPATPTLAQSHSPLTMTPPLPDAISTTKKHRCPPTGMSMRRTRTPTPPPQPAPTIAPLTAVGIPSPPPEEGPVVERAKGSPKTFGALGLEIDVSGREGLKVRKKRSVRKQ